MALQSGVPLLFRTRAALLAFICLSIACLPTRAQEAPPAQRFAQLQGGRIDAIRIEGNQRIEESTVRSYMLVQAGDPFDPDQLDRSLKTLYATGLFADVTLRREGGALIVKVRENPIVNRIAFEGNHKLTDDTLRPELQLRPRAVFTPSVAQADRQRLLDLYARRGRFAARIEPKIIPLDQNRVDVVFEIEDGDSTLTSRIIFVGNKAYGESRLRTVIGSREQAWWRFLSSTDNYDPDRVNFDKELLRRFYLQKGYADFEVVSANAELAPDKSAFFLTYTLNEGERYAVSTVDANITLRNVTKDELLPLIELSPDDWYDGDAVERSTQAISQYLQNHGFAFVDVKPRVQRDRAKHTIGLVFDVAEGPRVYVERIDITGNVRTKDKVVRREFRLAEGDPFNAELVRRSRQRLTDLDYFANVEITASPGSTPDRTIINTSIEEKATGTLSIGGGYSTDAGALASFGISEKNMVGTGIDAGISTTIAQKRTEATLSVTDPYFLDRNIVAGFDLFATQLTNLDIAQYRDRRYGGSVRVGYEFSEHLRQSWSYSIVQRDVFDVQQFASIYVRDQKGKSLLSQIGQTLTLDYRDSKLDPHSGFVVRLGFDYAGIGGTAHYIRSKIDGTYYLPLDRFTGNSDWTIAISGGAGYMDNLGRQEKIIDRFFLGGDNLRGFQTGGVGPHAIGTNGIVDSIGGRFIWTQSTELRFPLPISPDLGLTGRAFVDVGALSQVTAIAGSALFQSGAPRVGAGVGVSWKTPFGLINIDVGVPVVKKHFDQTQLIRFGFGTRF